MRKLFITVFLMLIWLCQLSGRYFVMLDFYLNQEYIAANLCENRDKPAMHCNGKCHLSKKLKEEDKRDQDNPERKDHRSEIFYAAWLQPTTLKPVATPSPKNYLHPYCIGTPIDQPTGVFRPPMA
ncbi:hypothetical protein [Chitinophaga sp. RAB17]|uniref:hypothetical protein n=1 Tax=Chitinophaga sp. RAB17 TaxID=3233049 RepID=UPI003F8FCC88